MKIKLMAFNGSPILWVVVLMLQIFPVAFGAEREDAVAGLIDKIDRLAERSSSVVFYSGNVEQVLLGPNPKLGLRGGNGDVIIFVEEDAKKGRKLSAFAVNKAGEVIGLGNESGWIVRLPLELVKSQIKQVSEKRMKSDRK
jgi:hypothetical protein